jgi:hypothetical protein
MTKRISKSKIKTKSTNDTNNLVKVQINSKTWVYVKPNLTEKEIDIIKARYNKPLFSEKM